jgi:hypothetical protein
MIALTEFSSTSHRSLQVQLRIAAALALTFSPIAAIADTTVIVSNCNDSGAGSLRSAIAAASTQSGDTVDMTQLSCSSISLTTGAITIAQQSLILEGPASQIAVSGKTGPEDRIFNHTGYGTLSLEHVDVSYGHATGTQQVRGGCVSSTGSVFLFYSSVSHCSANATNNYAYGGGIFARADLILNHSTIRENAVGNLPTSKVGNGGGAFVGRNLEAFYGTVADNSSNSSGGGLSVGAASTILASTISGNTASFAAGLNLFSSKPSTDRALINNSTISDNASSDIVGGVYSTIPVKLQNSTIAFNTAVNSTFVTSTQNAAGLMLSAINGSFTADLQSSILSDNTIGAVENDFATASSATHVVTTTGANMLIGKATGVVPIGTTVYGKCALLGPLRDNGGATKTRALMTHSPAIDAGNNNAVNPLTMGPYANDERGPGYPRVDNGQADIGAYEIQHADIVFDGGFDGCALL